jgi:hypothetical protein
MLHKLYYITLVHVIFGEVVCHVRKAGKSYTDTAAWQTVADLPLCSSTHLSTKKSVRSFFTCGINCYLLTP